MATKKKATATAKSKAPAPAALIGDMIAADAAKKVVAPDKLELLKGTAYKVQEIDKRLLKYGEVASELQKERFRLTTEVLPNLMSECEMPFFPLDEDTTVKLEDEVYASISQANAADACAWLTKNGYSAIVKEDIRIPLDKGDAKRSKMVQSLLKKNKIGFALTGGVHPATLKAFVKESIEKGRKLPESITFLQQPTAKLARVKPKKVKTKYQSNNQE